VHGTFSAIAAKFAGETPRQIAAHHRIALDHQQRRRDKIRADGTLIPRLRVRGMERFFVRRFGTDCLPDDGTGRKYLRLVADHLAQINPRMIRTWVATWAPWLTASDLDELIARVGIGKRWKADTLARELGLDDATRTATKNWTIGAIDCSRAQRKARQKRNDMLAARARREKVGATPRARSASATKQWIADGFNTRRTWERHGKKPRVANSSAVHLLPSSTTNLRQKAHQRAERAAERPKVAAQRSKIASTFLSVSGTKGRKGLGNEGTRFEPTPSIGRPFFSRIKGERDVEFARLQLVALAENAAQDKIQGGLWDAAIREAAAEWQEAKRALAAGEKPFIASLEAIAKFGENMRDWRRARLAAETVEQMEGATSAEILDAVRQRIDADKVVGRHRFEQHDLGGARSMAVAA
jgi:hypothetical protein